MEDDSLDDIDENKIISNIDEFWEANSESESDDTNNQEMHEKISFLKLKHKINKNFDVNLVHKYSSALDILASYINCHIIIYSEASYFCYFKLNLFMLPCIFFSTCCSVLSSFNSNKQRTILIISCLNGIISFLLAIINYLKLDACSEAHKSSAYQYSKLKNFIEFSSGEILLFQDPIIANQNFIDEQVALWVKINHHLYENEKEFNIDKNKIIVQFYEEKGNLEKKIVKDIQNKIVEIRKTLKNIEDNNNFILPQHIYSRYTKVYNANVFSYIKSIENYKFILLNELRNVKNEIRFYKKKSVTITETCKEKIVYLNKRKNNILKEFFELNKGYSLIDTMFQQEIKNINLYKKYWYLFMFQKMIHIFRKCCYCKTKLNVLPKYYKKCTKVGYIDEQGDYLLEKILHTC